MLFNSTTFFIFLAIVYALYLAFQQRYKWQNILLLVSSYVFYGFWNWKFLSLIAASTLLDFYVGQKLFKTKDKTSKKCWLWLSICFNLGVLAFFKYFNFFAESFAELLQLIGFQADFITLNIILPVGISFYTFQTLSYTIDIYRGKLQPINSLTDFALFVSFFPQLVAGPIERAANLLPQIQSPRILKLPQIHAGIFLILWGLFKKVVIADNLAVIVNTVFNNYTAYSGLDLGLAVLAFAFQIYGDFSGYTDIARGVSKLMGFELMLNFKLPYFATNPSDFWRRWHVSLSSWLRDYLYIPLGGNRYGQWKTFRNLFYTMLLGGLWHGAAWNFVIWGAYHGGLLVLYKVFDYRSRTSWGNLKPLLKTRQRREKYGVVVQKLQPSVQQKDTQPCPFRLSIENQLMSLAYEFGHWLKYFLKMLLMFGFTLIGWLIFRATSVEQIVWFFHHFSWQSSVETADFAFQCAFFISPLLLVQVWQAKSKNLLVVLKQPFWIVGLFYAFLIVGIVFFGVREATEFIYFQF